MEILQFKNHALWINIAVFIGSAIVVWIAGTRVARYADGIARVTGVGHATVGLLLLAGVTSLPEIAVTVTASVGGNAPLAVNNLLGSVAMQVAILAVADAVIGQDALTSVIADPIVLLQLALNILLLALFACAAMTGDVGVFGVGAWSWGLLGACVGSIWLISRSQGRRPWVIDGGLFEAQKRERKAQAGAHGETGEPVLRSLVRKTIVAGAAILVAGFLLSRTGEAIASQTGIGQSFGGFALVAVSTSLPEVSTVISAVRLRRYVMAVSDIFGTNLFNIGLIFVVDLAYRGAPILNDVGRFSVFAALLGVIVTTLFLTGLIERRDRTIAGMGIDSFAVLAAYIGGVAMLYTMR